MEAEELNPFSFREFLRWKNQDPDQDPDQDHDQEQKNWKVWKLDYVYPTRAGRGLSFCVLCPGNGSVCGQTVVKLWSNCDPSRPDHVCPESDVLQDISSLFVCRSAAL